MKNTILIFLFFWIFSTPLIIAQTPQWANTASSGTSTHDARHIKLDQAGDIYVAGNFLHKLNFSNSDVEFSSYGGKNTYLYKKSPSGVLLWVRAIAGGASINEVMDMGIDKDGNIYLVGQFRGVLAVGSGGNSISLTANGTGAGYIAKFSPTGALLGAHTVGGISRDNFNAIGFDADNNIILAGNFKGEVDFDLSQNSHIEDCTGLTLVKYSENFELISVNKLNSVYTVVTNIDVNAEGEIIFGGYFRESVTHSAGWGIIGGPQYTDLSFLMKLSATFEFEWVTGIIGTSTQYIRDMQLTPSGDIFITGDISHTASFISNSGTETIETNAGSRDVFFAKISSAGNFEWIKTMGGVGEDIGSKLDLDTDGNIVLAGSYSHTMDFDSGSGTAEYTSEASSSSYVSIYTPNGDYVNTFTFGNPNGNAATGIAVNENNEIYLLGWFKWSINLDSSQPGYAFTSPAEDSYLLKMSAIIVGMDEAHDDRLISIYPNPAQDEIHIAASNIRKLEVYNIHGKLVLSNAAQAFGDRQTLGVYHLPAGTYILSLTANGGFVGSEKFIIIR